MKVEDIIIYLSQIKRIVRILCTFVCQKLLRDNLDETDENINYLN